MALVRAIRSNFMICVVGVLLFGMVLAAFGSAR